MGRGGLRKGRELAPGTFGLRLSELPRPMTGPALFGNDRPLELEIGSGTGTLLVKESLRRPEVNFVGVEYTKRYFRLAADRLRRQQRENARVVDAEAGELLGGYIDDESLHGIHIYFPDPWPKRRHHPRRFVQSDRIELLTRKMVPGARLRIVTDHAQYFSHIEQVIASSRLEPASFEPLTDGDEDVLVGTNFEHKYIEEGRPFYALAAIRV